MRERKVVFYSLYFFFVLQQHLIDGNLWEFRATYDSSFWWSLWSLEHVDGEFPEVKRVLVGGWLRDNTTSNRHSIDRCIENKDRRAKVEGSQGKELSLPSDWPINLGNNSLQRHLQADLGFHEEKVPRFIKGKKNTASSTSHRVRDFTHEVGREGFELLLQNDGYHQ